MATIVTRASKGSPLTHNEVDANFVNLNTDKAEAASYVAKNGDTMTGPLVLDADPTSASQAATKKYVDTIAAAGIHYHAPVRVEGSIAYTTTYDNGTAGVGATLTNAGTQAVLVIDGITVIVGDRVLIYKQPIETKNGVYTVTDVGSGSTNWVLTRATDADSYGASDPDALGQGDAFFVNEGSSAAGLYVCNTVGEIIFGTTNIVFTQIAATAVYSAGTGLALTGTVFSNTITNNNQLTNGSGYITSAGNAATATTALSADVAVKLQTARTIGGVSFDGTANINLAGVNIAGTQNTSGNAATATSATTAASCSGNAATATQLATARLLGGVSFNGTANINLAGVNIAGNQNTSGSSASCTGNAATATTLQTARTINGVSFNGSADITVADSTKLPLAGGTVTGNVVMSGDTFTTYGPNTGWGSYLRVGGSGSTATGSMASIVTTNGNLHMDGGDGSGIYLNWYNNSSGGVIFGNGASGQIGNIDSAGNLTMSGNVTAYSDVRLKSNIQTIESGLDKVCAMRGVTFEKDGVAGLGVIAQEVEAIIPEVVMTHNDGIKSVAYGNIVGVLIEAIKELKDKVESLEAQLQEK